MTVLADYYQQLATNYRILWENPSACSAVGFLQLLTTLLLFVLLLRIGLHGVVIALLRVRCQILEPVHGSRLAGIYGRCWKQVGLRRPPIIYCLHDRSMAFTTGLWRGDLFIAPELVDDLEDDELEAVLTHELIHVRRRDHLRVWGWELGAALLPALIVQLFALSFVFSETASKAAALGAGLGYVLLRLLLRGTIRHLRERSCDDRTVEVTGDPLALASSLVQVWRSSVASGRTSAGWALACSSLVRGDSLTERRIGRLLSYRRPGLRLMLGRSVELTVATGTLLAILFVGSLYWTGRANAELAFACTLSGAQTLVMVHH